MYQRDDYDLGGAGAMARAGAARRAPASRRRRIRFDPVVDLGADIGSLAWWRGLATLAAGIGVLVHVSPGLAPLPGAGAPPVFHADIGRQTPPTGRERRLAAAPDRARLALVADLGPGDGFERVIERSGASPADAATAAALVAQALPPDAIAPGTRIALALGRRPDRSVTRPLDALSFRARLDLAVAVRRVAGRLTLVRTPIAVDATPLRLAGSVGDSLYRSARAAGAPPDVVAQYIRAIAPHVDLDTIAPGDRFDMVMERRRAAAGEVETGRLLYAGLAHADGTLRLVRWTAGGQDQFYDADGFGAHRETGLLLPVGGRLSSGFGMRFHPILGFTRMHEGVDLAAPYGSPIAAAADGVVAYAGWRGGYGNFVQLAHAGGMATGYGHMSRIAVQAGERVRQGAIIGYIGSTGLSTGPHVHFEVRRDGVAIDPLSARIAGAPQLTGRGLARLRAALARLAALPTG